MLKDLEAASPPGECDHAKEAKILFPLFAVLRENIHSPDTNKRADLRKVLDRAIDSSQQAQTPPSEKSKRLNTAIGAYGEFESPALVDKYSETLLSLYSKQEAFPLYSGPTDIAILNLACNIFLPAPITNLCDNSMKMTNRGHWLDVETLATPVTCLISNM